MVKKKHLLAALVVSLAAVSAAAADPLSEESCSVVVTQGDGKVDYGRVQSVGPAWSGREGRDASEGERLQFRHR